MRLPVLSICLALTLSTAFAAEFPPADHAGGSLILADGDVIWGAHGSVGSFTIPEGANVRVRAYHPTEPGTGAFELQAGSITIDGTLSATASGYSGGSGGGGGAGYYVLQSRAGVPGQPGAVPYGADGLQGAGGQEASGGSAFGPGGTGGAGGNGDGARGGTGAATSGSPGEDGFYAAVFGPAEPLTLGSGGGAGAGNTGSQGHNESAMGGAGGGAGGRGGGLINLRATHTLTLGPNSLIATNGATGGNAIPPNDTESCLCDGGAGGNADAPGEGTGDTLFHPQNIGGAGSGGAILLDLSSAHTLSVSPTAAIQSLGGRNQLTNGGVVIIKSPPSVNSIGQDQINAFAVYELIHSGAEAAWLLY